MSLPRAPELPKDRREMVEPDSVRSPREGWASLALFMVMLVTVAMAVDDADWAGLGPSLGRQTGFLPIAAVLAGLIGFVLAKSRMGAVMAHTLGAVLGSTLLLVAVSGSVSSEPALADRLRALAESTEIFYDDLVVLGIRSSETSVFLLLLGTLLWAIGQFGAFNIFRRGRAMPAVVAAGLALLINMSITVRLQYLHLIVFSAAAMLLLVRLNLLVQQEGWRKRWISDTGQVSSLFMRVGIAFVLLTLTGSIALAATASSAPLANAWRNADDHLLNIGAEVNRLVGGVTGASRGPSGLFSSSQTIRGVWESSPDVVFTATSTDDEGHYWRGAVYDHFDGFTWQQLGRTRLEVPAGADLLAESFDSVLEEDGRKRVTLTVTSVDLAGGTLLSPETPLVVDRDAEVLTNDPAGPLVAIDLRDAIDPGESFTVTAMVPDPDADKDELVTAADLAAAGIEYPSWTRRFIDIRPGSIGDLTYQTADQIVGLLPADERDPYHVADAMQSFLYRDGGFQYRTDVRGLCGRDKVVDCFLTTRVGYCEHFATAMVMLLRTQQIPARLAMGYLPGREVAEGSWVVDRRAAHAWVEVYFPSYGWIKFDPTPGNAENGQEPTQLARGEPTPPPRSAAGTHFDASLRSLEDPRGDAGPPVPPIDPTGGGLPQAPPPADPGPIAALAIGAILMAIALVALLTRLRRMPSPEPDLAYRGVARLAGRFGYGPQPTQTAYEYAGSLSALLPAVRSELTVVARAKVETTYARRAPDAQMLEQLRAAYRRVRIGLLRLIFRRRVRPTGPRELGSRSGASTPIAFLRTERWRFLRTIDRLLARPLDILAFVWLVLLVVELAGGGDARLERVIFGIWAIFIADVVLDLVIAPDRLSYLRRNWLTLLSLLLPALRVFRGLRALRVLRAARSIRSIGLLRILTSLNRGMAALARTFGRRNLGFVVALSAAVVMVGAAGMAFLESPLALREAGRSGVGLSSYGEALWWTAMLLTTIGSEYWPVTLEGRVLAWLLAVYGVAIFGYITAAIASHFIESDRGAAARGDASVAALVAEVAALRSRIDELVEYQKRPTKT